MLELNISHISYCTHLMCDNQYILRLTHVKLKTTNNKNQINTNQTVKKVYANAWKTNLKSECMDCGLNQKSSKLLSSKRFSFDSVLSKTAVGDRGGASFITRGILSSSEIELRLEQLLTSSVCRSVFFKWIWQDSYILLFRNIGR